MDRPDPRDADPLVLIEDQERPLVTTSSPLLIIPAEVRRPSLRWIVALVAGAFLAGFIVRAALATPRSAPDIVSRFGDERIVSQGPSGVPRGGNSHGQGPSLASAPLSSGTPISGIGSPLEGVRGLATWYCCTRGHPSGLYAAAGPALRVGDWRGRGVTVSGPGGTVRVTMIDACACGHGRVIDLYPQAFRRLAPLSQGVVGVTVSWGGTLPATDTGP